MVGYQHMGFLKRGILQALDLERDTASFRKRREARRLIVQPQPLRDRATVLSQVTRAIGESKAQKKAQ